MGSATCDVVRVCASMRFVGAICSSRSSEMDARGRTGWRGGGAEHPSDRARAARPDRRSRVTWVVCHAGGRRQAPSDSGSGEKLKTSLASTSLRIPSAASPALYFILAPSPCAARSPRGPFPPPFARRPPRSRACLPRNHWPRDLHRSSHTPPSQ